MPIAASWITRCLNVKHAVGNRNRWLLTQRVTGTALLERLNCSGQKTWCSGWKMNTASAVGVGGTRLDSCHPLEQLVKLMDAVVACPTFVADERAGG
ncbi:hypothetical protein OS493_013419 [Desmophyllum pertusum]|uniref:Uncharacterized protein n=1 Tax=Desmophyllum pertusum TaxID=174260 RepID=A0A9X0CFN5_9CNID|nr:hypothetical protein OS493_013419 [Desmophyllum pertusum]